MADLVYILKKDFNTILWESSLANVYYKPVLAIIWDKKDFGWKNLGLAL